MAHSGIRRTATSGLDCPGWNRVSVYRNFLYAAVSSAPVAHRRPNRVVTPRCDPTDTCFNRNNVRSFEVLDRETIIVEVGSGRCRFLVEVDGIMCDVAVTGRVGFLDSDGRICGGGQFAADNGSVPAEQHRRCMPIRDVRAVSDDELLERYASLGRIRPCRLWVREKCALKRTPRWRVRKARATRRASIQPNSARIRPCPTQRRSVPGIARLTWTTGKQDLRRTDRSTGFAECLL